MNENVSFPTMNKKNRFSSSPPTLSLSFFLTKWNQKVAPCPRSIFSFFLSQKKSLSKTSLLCRRRTDSRTGVYYGDYLQVEKLLSCVQPESAKSGVAAHDEHLFIVIHQSKTSKTCCNFWAIWTWAMCFLFLMQ